METDCHFPLAYTLNFLASFSLHCAHLMKSQPWLHSTLHLGHTRVMMDLEKNTSHIEVTRFTFMTTISSEYLMLPSGHSVLPWSIYSFFYTFYFYFKSVVLPPLSFLLTNGLDIDFTEKIKADRKEFHNPLLPYLPMCSIYTHLLCLSLDSFLSYHFNISLFTKSFSLTHTMLPSLQY